MSSFRRTDLLTLAGLREDGRRPDELRRIGVTLGPLTRVDISGSALFRMGLTCALASVVGPTECRRRSEERNDGATLDVRMRVSGGHTGGSDETSVAAQTRLLQTVLEACVRRELYPRSCIRVNVRVLADDGGRLCAAINACSLALVDAGLATTDVVCACAAGSGGLLDPGRSEDKEGQVTCALFPSRDKLVLSHFVSPKVPVPLEHYEDLLDKAMSGCRTIHRIVDAELRDRAAKLLAAHGGNAPIALVFEEENFSMDV